MIRTNFDLDIIAAKFVSIGLRAASRLGIDNFLINCLFVFLPLRWSTRLVILLRKHRHNRDLDRHFRFFCGPELGRDLSWLRSSLVERGYANEVWYYLYLTDHYQLALDLFPQLDWQQADNDILKALNEFAQGADSGYLMNLLAQIHFVDWSATEKNNLFAFSKATRTMMDNRVFEVEERNYRHKELSNPDLAHAEIDRYIPHFFRNKWIIESLQSALGLHRHQDIASQLENAGQYWEPYPNANTPEAASVACYYAYNYLQARTYNNGEGARVSALAQAAVRNRNGLRAHMPIASKELRAALEQAGIGELHELRLLSPDWGAVIGHSGHLNVHLMMRELGWWSGSPLLLTYADKIANRPFLKLMEDRCPTWIAGENVSFSVWHELAGLTPFVSEAQTFELPDGRIVNWNDAGAMAVAEWQRQGRGAHLRDRYDGLSTTGEVCARFDRLRTSWGMTPKDWYVCLHMRDAATRGNVEGEGESIRNTELRNYFDAVNHIVSLGGWVVRMGGPKAPQLPPMKQVIDYAHSVDKSAEMDIHIVRHARAFIGTTSGFSYVASSFDIPSAIVDAISSIGLLWTKNTRFTTKLVRTQQGRLLSLAELTSEQFRWSLANFESLDRAGLTVEDNSSDEILEATKEVTGLALVEPDANAPTADPSWTRGFENPDFFGASRPSRYFIDKRRELLQ
ncbi:TIGR04372 family glycosyltransferase [Bradyrhizobium sp. SZCCHNPS1003]|uniref:TIGR04372 family glycosyltransferase n=1 Tax=Bradyrhizobium sp. SZCCHNPS1003 TaxID=3057330 RepID=UPI0028EDCE27|nr:TIGR04372 family glycosyltransferase [Bradyrhizobium sp. SZCCHNPS1003]